MVVVRGLGVGKWGIGRLKNIVFDDKGCVSKKAFRIRRFLECPDHDRNQEKRGRGKKRRRKSTTMEGRSTRKRRPLTPTFIASSGFSPSPVLRLLSPRQRRESRDGRPKSARRIKTDQGNRGGALTVADLLQLVELQPKPFSDIVERLPEPLARDPR